MPVLANLFGTPLRVALGMGKDEVAELREIGHLLAVLKEPEPPRGWRDVWDKLPLVKQVFSMVPADSVRRALPGSHTRSRRGES